MKRATYEVSFNESTAAFARFGRALVECDAQLLCARLHADHMARREVFR